MKKEWKIEELNDETTECAEYYTNKSEAIKDFEKLCQDKSKNHLDFVLYESTPIKTRIGGIQK